MTCKNILKKGLKTTLEVLHRVALLRSAESKSQQEKIGGKNYGNSFPFMPLDFLWFSGLAKYLTLFVTGLFKPMYGEVRRSDISVAVHETYTLTTETPLMLSCSIDKPKGLYGERIRIPFHDAHHEINAMNF